MRQFFTKNRTAFSTLMVVAMILVAGPACAEGLEKANQFLEKVAGFLQGAGILVATIAIMVAGYKIIFGGQTFREVVPIFIGGFFIGSASYVASYLIA